jgi:DNA-binding NtrC family response regulator
VIRLLFIDDNPAEHQTLQLILEEGYVVLSAFTAAEGLELLESEAPDVVLLDIDLPDCSGLDLLEQILSRPLAPPVIMLTAFGKVEFVKRAIQAGAYDYLLKPYTFEQVEGTVRRAVQNIALRRELGSGERCAELEELVGDGGRMRELKSVVARYARADSPVLIQGESGTGKELVARAIHRLSPRREGPFLAVNCGAIPLPLLETELFGSQRGAYTDATTRAGCFERAAGGTIFLDEIGEMPLAAQVSLLRVLEAKELHRVGGSEAIALNVRVLSASNRDLREEVQRGRFREDLFYRIDVLHLTVPALRQRLEDLPALATFLLGQLSGGALRLSPGALQKLSDYHWPGNVRELRNVIERAAVLAEGQEIRPPEIRF